MDLDAHPDVLRLAAARPSRAADLVSAVTDPAVLVLAVLLLDAARFSASWAAAAGWAALSALFCVGLPLLVLAVLVGRGLVLDRQVVVREQRRLPLALAATSLVVGLVLLALLGAPQQLVNLLVGMVTGLAAMAAVSHWHKASFHVAVAAGIAVHLGLTLAWWAAAAMVPVIAVIGWARVRRGRHTRGQVVLGLVVGTLSALVVYPLLP